MFAVIEDGNRQYKVQTGDLLVVDYRADAAEGQAMTFDKVLLANAGGASVIGKPTTAFTASERRSSLANLARQNDRVL